MVSATTSDGIESQFTVSASISAVTLPTTPTLKSAFDLSQARLGLAYKILPQDKLHLMWMKYAQELLTTYRLNPGNFYEADGTRSHFEVWHNSLHQLNAPFSTKGQSLWRLGTAQ